MTQYIDKDDLVAEIKKRIKSTNNDVKIGAIESLTVSKTLNSLISFINTLEVKEVDLEKVFLDEYSKFSNDVDAMDYAFPIDLADYKDFARHFFELGLSASNKAQRGE